MFGNVLNAKTGQPLFFNQAWGKANAILELAHQGYLSDIDGFGIQVFSRCAKKETPKAL
jgi:hypothetical protein